MYGLVKNDVSLSGGRVTVTFIAIGLNVKTSWAPKIPSFLLK